MSETTEAGNNDRNYALISELNARVSNLEVVIHALIGILNHPEMQKVGFQHYQSLGNADYVMNGEFMQVPWVPRDAVES